MRDGQNRAIREENLYHPGFFFVAYRLFAATTITTSITTAKAFFHASVLP